MKKVAVLHTSPLFLKVDPLLQDLFRELLPETAVVDFLDSDILATVNREGGISPASQRRMLYLAQAGEEAGCDAIFFTCSAIGPTMEVARKLVNIPVVRIDEPMMRAAVRAAARKSGRVGILATAPATLAPSSDLLRCKAAEAGLAVEALPALCEGAFDALLQGDRQRHDAIVLDTARHLASQVDTLVLAQGSMSRLAQVIASEVQLEVLSSPRLALEYLKEIL